MSFLQQNLSLLSALIAIMATGFATVIAFSRRFDRQSEITIELLKTLSDREFHARYSEQREKTEYAIARLNEKLTDTLSEFRSVNHLIIDGQKRMVSTDNVHVDPNAFLTSMNIRASEVSYEKDLVFVLTPFHPRERLTYSAIVEAFDGLPVRIQRGDEDDISSEVLSHIVSKIVSARLVIANISSRNPNVMYELGIAHALGKSVIVVSSSDEELPFDFRSRSILLYKSRKDLIEKLKTEVGRKFFSGLPTSST